MAFDNVCPPLALSNEHEFFLTTFNVLTTCSVCQKYLNGLICQGYQCRKTSMCVHKECIAKVNAPSDSGSEPRDQASSAISQRSIGSRPAIATPQSKQVSTNRNQNPSSTTEAAAAAAANNVPPTPAASRGTRRNQNNRHTVMRPDKLDGYPWFAGVTNRKDASAILENLSEGTYLIRVSIEDDSPEEKFALSVKGEGRHIKHIRIRKNKDQSYCLVEATKFSTILDLVEYYQRNSLEENFATIRTALLTPYQSVEQERRAVSNQPVDYCKALFDFAARSQRELSFKEGDIIEITNKSGKWWKGKLGEKSGVFPFNYVEEIPD